ncbi:GNAT family acetyltransferase [Oerskovia flava]|uniref:GNAT family acetyltransferase n=1 Tax=Oerskovia flava TaxID=2986422 RepID=UPI002AD5632D|nr:GNAT family acetyltransferase [Oerskovia sp. JB1-3-2]
MPGRIGDGGRLARGPQGSGRPTGGRLRVAEITDTDVDDVIALWRACDLTRPWNDPARDVADARIAPSATVLVGRLGDDVVAAVMAGYDGHRGWLYYLAVDPELRGGGYGRDLVVAGEAWLAAAGARKVQLMVRGTNDGVRGFYDALGYTAADVVVLSRWFEEPPGGAP